MKHQFSNSNCYAYAFNKTFLFDGELHIQPGEYQNKRLLSYEGVTSPTDPITERLLDYIQLDAEALDKHFIPYSDAIENGYEVALVINPTLGDYHWYRENGDGTWSHKQGGTPATDQIGIKILPNGIKEEIKGIITNPQEAAFIVGYTNFIGYFSVFDCEGKDCKFEERCEY